MTAKLTAKAIAAAERAARVEKERRDLLTYLSPGRAVYVSVLHRSTSGMRRVVRLYLAHGGEILNITHSTSELLDYRLDRERGGIVLDGCGYDIAHHVVTHLAQRLFDNDRALVPRSL